MSYSSEYDSTEESYVSSDSISSSDKTIFDYLSDKDDEKVIEILEELSLQEAKNLKGEYGGVLCHAIEDKCSDDLVEFLIEHGFDPKEKNHKGEDMFQLAMFKRLFRIVKVLYNRGMESKAPPVRVRRWTESYDELLKLYKSNFDLKFLDTSTTKFDWNSIDNKTFSSELLKYSPVINFLDSVHKSFIGEGSWGTVYRIDLADDKSFAYKTQLLDGTSPVMTYTVTKGYTTADRTNVVFKGKHAIIPRNEVITEYLLGKLVGDLEQDGSSINFLPCIVGGRHRKAEKKYEWRMLFKRLNGEIIDKFCDDNIEEIKEQLPTYDVDYNVDMAVFGVIHALAVAQTRFGFVHNDLSGSNVMVEFIKPHTPTFLNTRDSSTRPIAEYDYFRYNVVDGENTTVFEFDRDKIAFIPKIVDLGLACKFSDVDGVNPILASYSSKDKEGYFPGYYHEAIDIVMFLHCIFYYSSGEKMRTPFVRKVAEWFYERLPGSDIEDKINRQHRTNTPKGEKSKRVNYLTFQKDYHMKTPREFFKLKWVRERFEKKVAPPIHDVNSIVLGNVKW
jgi:hypothetical protein